MKKLQYATLLIALCATISQITAQTNDSLKIAPAQVKNIYQGLQERAQFKQKLSDCLEVANSLNDLIQQQNDSLQSNANKLIDLNKNLATANKNYTDTAVKLQKLQDRKIPWYKHPVLYSILGLLGGIWIAK